MEYRELKKHLRVKKFTQEEIAEKIGMSRAGLNKALLNDTLKRKDLSKIAQILEVEIWELDDDFMDNNQGKTNPVNNQIEDKKGIPLVGIEAIGGFGSSDFMIKESDILDRYIIPDFDKIDFMIRVKGESMYPKYSSGDIVSCRTLKESSFIQWNKVHIIATREQGILIKRIKPSEDKNSLMAISENSDYPPFDIPKNEITGIALVIGVIRLE